MFLLLESVFLSESNFGWEWYAELVEEPSVGIRHFREEPGRRLKRGEFIMKQKKMLFLGTPFGFEDAVTYAKELGVHTIVTDYATSEQNPKKRMADEAWQIDVKDIDSLEQRCRAEQVDALFTGANEFCLDVCRELAHRLGLPFYGDNAAYDVSRNKSVYKKLCMQYGLEVPKRYELDERMLPEQIAQIRFPVMVKPSDSGGQQGITVVRDASGLKAAYDYALSFSDNQDILVEDYIEGDDFFVGAYAHDGEIMLLNVGRNVSDSLINGRKNFSFILTCDSDRELVKNELISKYAKLITDLGARDGHIAFQGMIKDHVVYNLECGYRLDGLYGWRSYELNYNFNYLKAMVNHALQIKTPASVYEGFNKQGKNPVLLSYAIWIVPGKVAKICGEEVLENRDDLSVAFKNFREGMVVPKRDNMRNLAYFVYICANSHEEMAEKVDQINGKLHIYDETGADMLIYGGNYLALVEQVSQSEGHRTAQTAGAF